jgi:hypothetical protein
VQVTEKRNYGCIDNIDIIDCSIKCRKQIASRKCARNNYTKNIGHLQTNMHRSPTYLEPKPPCQRRSAIAKPACNPAPASTSQWKCCTPLRHRNHRAGYKQRVAIAAWPQQKPQTLDVEMEERREIPSPRWEDAGLGFHDG